MATETASRGLRLATSAPDLTATYYLLLTTNMSTQEMGQFLPATVAWGIPPFAPATQSLTVMNRGSLVLDFSAGGKVVWRGVAQANIQTDADDKRREKLLREGVRDLLEEVSAQDADRRAAAPLPPSAEVATAPSSSWSSPHPRVAPRAYLKMFRAFRIPINTLAPMIDRMMLPTSEAGATPISPAQPRSSQAPTMPTTMLAIDPI